MKKIIALALTLLMALTLTACGGKDRILYKSANLEKFVDLADYKGITVDTSSKEYKELYEEILKADKEANDLYNKKTEGVVAEGDTVDIDFVGKKDDKAFDGGTAQGYDLEIGSGSFIDGFEEGLIGVEVGKTVDLNLKFPENYGNEELNGAAVVFTVTVNHIEPEEKVYLEPRDYFKDLGYKTLEDYESYIKDQAVENLLIEQIIEKSEVKDYPKEDKEMLLGEFTDLILAQYNTTVDELLTQNNMTKDDFNNTLLEQNVIPIMDNSLVLYAIIDKEKLEVTDEKIEEAIKKLAKQNNDTSITVENLRKNGEYYPELLTVSRMAIDVVKENAKIK
ncbi:MAG: FKBP-type peptidyl-prolyl cis-trans isomerase [Clostridia bacterium]|nr:FKBP-type peptidyl-prolyl cis-trans isomerase [Clostridia bacterium]